MRRFTVAMVLEVIQPFWEVMQRGEFKTTTDILVEWEARFPMYTPVADAPKTARKFFADWGVDDPMYE